MSATARRAGMRRLGRVLFGVALGVTALAGVLAAGLAQAGGTSPLPSPESAAAPWRPGAPLVVAVALGRTGIDAADALAPYEVFARSPRFEVYTIAADSSPAGLNGGLAIQPAFTFADTRTGAARKPDLVVVPAVNDPAGPAESELRQWLIEQARSGASVLGVCAGSRVLAATGLLDGHRATSHWSRIAQLEDGYPAVDWVRGERYVQDGGITTTGGVTSGIPGALKVMRDLAGDAEAERVGRELDYPSWSLGGGTEIPVQAFSLGDLGVGLNFLFPWFRPTVGVLLADGVGEVDAVAPFEVNSYASSATLLPLGEGTSITTRHGLVVSTTPMDREPGGLTRAVVPGVDRLPSALAAWAADRDIEVSALRSTEGRLGFDAALEDLSRHTDGVTARATAKMIEYPIERLALAGGFDRRAPLLLAAALVVATAAALLPSGVRAVARRRRASRRAMDGVPGRRQEELVR